MVGQELPQVPLFPLPEASANEVAPEPSYRETRRAEGGWQ